MSWLYTIIFAGLVFASQGAEDPEAKKAFEAVTVPVEYSIQDETERFEQTYPFNADGRVSVSNINGSITIEGWNRNEIRFEYVKSADSKERLADVDVKIDAQTSYFKVETDYGNERQTWSGDRRRNQGRLSVAMKLMVPMGALLREIETVNGAVTASNFTNEVRISAVNGSIKAWNLRGNTDLSTVNGQVNADFDQLGTAGRISLNTVNGSVKLTIPSDSNATLRADSLSGSITNDFGLQVRRGKYVGRDLRGRLGSGETEIKLNSVSGSLSISRRNDGRPLSPATNLLPAKSGDDDDSETSDIESAVRGIREAKIEAEREIEHAKREIERDRERIRNVIVGQPELEKITAEAAALASEITKQTAKVFSSADVKKHLSDAMALRTESLGRMIEAGFSSAYPRIETKTGSFEVKDVPNVRVNSKGCSIRIIGWPSNKVEYKVIQHRAAMYQEPIGVNEIVEDDGVTLNFSNPNTDGRRGQSYSDSDRATIEIYVPKKSNVTVESDRDIRVESISGKIELKGQDESINIRDSDGDLRVTNVDGRIRLVGFKGAVEARTADGSINLEGSFSKLSARSGDGTIVVTVPGDTSADIISNSPDVKGEGLNVELRSSTERYAFRIGKGGVPFVIETEANIIIRSSDTIRDKS